MSPRKSGPPPNAPSRQPRAAPCGKDSPAPQRKEGGAKVNQKAPPAGKTRKTQVMMMMMKLVKQYRLVRKMKVW